MKQPTLAAVVAVALRSGAGTRWQTLVDGSRPAPAVMPRVQSQRPPTTRSRGRLPLLQEHAQVCVKRIGMGLVTKAQQLQPRSLDLPCLAQQLPLQIGHALHVAHLFAAVDDAGQHPEPGA